MKRLLSLSLYLLFFYSSKGQSYDTTNFYGKMNYVFQYVDKSAITSGLLWDYGIEFAKLENFNGVSLHDSNWVTITDWRMLYSSLYSQQITSSTSMSSMSSINTALNAYSSSSQPVAFAILNYNYDQLDNNAVNNNLLSVYNDQIYDVPGRSQSPYLSQNVFAIAPLVQSITNGNQQFIFRSNLYYSNTGKQVSTIQIDPFGNGTYQSCSWDTPFTVTYGSDGVYNVNFIITFSDNSVCYSHTKIAVNATTATLASLNKRASDTSTIHYGPPFTEDAFIYGTRSQYYPQTITADKSYLGVQAVGDYTIDLSVNNTSGQIQKPLIIVEGFDPYAKDSYTGSTYIGDYIDRINSDLNSFPTYSPIPLNGTSGLDNANSYDIIYLHWHNGTDYIERNAYLLEKLITWVNTNKASSEQNVIIGMSMGGLVVRYALRDMELNNESHQTRLFISHDAPHWGANVPPAYQSLVQYIAPWQIANPGFSNNFPYVITWQDLFPDAVDALDLFNSPAAKEMLIQRYTLNSSFGAYNLSSDNSAHNSFLSSLNSMGWPTGCRNIVLGNGSCNGTTQFNDNSQMLGINGSQNWSYLGSLWRSLVMSLGGFVNATGLPTLNSIPVNNLALVLQFPLSLASTKTSLNFDWGAWAAPVSGTSLIFKGDIIVRRQILFLINVNSYILKCHVNNTNDMLPLDNAPGGVYDLDKFGLSVNTVNQQIRQSLGNWITASVSQPRFCFVPTVSSLALSNPQSNLRSSLCSNIPCLLPSQVADYYAPASNQVHISYTTDNSNWILQQQSSSYTCSQICPSNLSISGDDLFCNTSNSYFVNNLPSGTSVAWSTSNSGIASPNTPSATTTTLSKSSDGTITLYAAVNNGCGSTTPISKPDIVVGNSVSGYYNVSSNTIVQNGISLANGGGSVFVPKNNSVLYSIQLTNPTLSSPAWSVTGTYSTYYSGSNYLNLYMVAPSTSYSSNNATVNIGGTGPCGTISKNFNFQVVASGSGFSMMASPNPAKGQINVTIVETNTETKEETMAIASRQAASTNNTTTMELFNFNSSELVKKWVFNEKKSMQYNLNIRGVNAGIYLLKMTRNGKIVNTKVIVQ